MSKELKNIKCHIDNLLTDEIKNHAFIDTSEHPIDFQVFRLLTGYEEALEENKRLKAKIERKDDAIGYCSNMIICAVNSIKYGYIHKADEQLNSGLSEIQEALSTKEDSDESN